MMGVVRGAGPPGAILLPSGMMEEMGEVEPQTLWVVDPITEEVDVCELMMDIAWVVVMVIVDMETEFMDLS